MKAIPLYGELAAGRVALVDDADYELVSQHRWHISRQLRNCRPSGPYAATIIQRNGRQTTVRMHALITGWPRTDHINGDGLDNQRANLRPASLGQNAANSPARGHGTSQYKGVYWSSAMRKWHAAIRVGGQRRHLGYFADELEAARAYHEAAREAWGEYAWSGESHE
jgi:hypothetical protein